MKLETDKEKKLSTKTDETTEVDLTAYLDKPATDLQARFAEWLMDEEIVGYDPGKAKTKQEAFEAGVRLATAMRMIFQASPENREANAAKKAAKATEEPEEEPTPKKAKKAAAKAEPEPEPVKKKAKKAAAPPEEEPTPAKKATKTAVKKRKASADDDEAPF